MVFPVFMGNSQGVQPDVSEKNIKALFDRYRSICKNNPLAPILLFNEADSVPGVRMEGALVPPAAE